MLEFEIVGLGPLSVDESARCTRTLTTNFSIIATMPPLGDVGIRSTIWRWFPSIQRCWAMLRRALAHKKSSLRSQSQSKGPMLLSNATLQAYIELHVFSMLKESNCLKPCHYCPRYHHTYAPCPQSASTFAIGFQPHVLVFLPLRVPHSFFVFMQAQDTLLVTSMAFCLSGS